jgi:site-specific DNA-methyltransferase (adenine-specific)
MAPLWTLSQLDAIDFLRGLGDSSADLIVTDPAYESLEKHRAKGTTTRLKESKASSNPWFPIFPNARFPVLFAEMFRVLARNAHLYTFCDNETSFVIHPIAVATGFRYWNTIIWDKYPNGGFGMGYHYRKRYECVMFFEKGHRKLRTMSVSDIIEVPLIKRGYPTEKPAEVSRVLIDQSASAGQLVVDPFMGSGSVGVAALGLGCRFLGNDSETSALALAADRLRSAEQTAAADQAIVSAAPESAPWDGPAPWEEE